MLKVCSVCHCTSPNTQNELIKPFHFIFHFKAEIAIQIQRGSFFPLICLHLCVGSNMDFCMLCSVALKVTDLNAELPGNCSCVLAYCCQSARDACWQRQEGSCLSCPSLIKGLIQGLTAWPLGSNLSDCVCVCANGSSWSRILGF